MKKLIIIILAVILLFALGIEFAEADFDIDVITSGAIIENTIDRIKSWIPIDF